jgi:ribulose-phosphate 3-epimerase
MKIISPSLLASDFLNIESEMNAFNEAENIWFHLDIMDGHFVPNLTFGHPIVELICKKSKHKCDAHFMVKNPEFYAETMKTYGIHNFTFHYESIIDSSGLILELKKDYPSVGISIKPNTPTTKLSDDILNNVDLVLVMSVEPGFGGQSFIPSTYQKILELKNRRDSLKAKFSIQIDGGVSLENAALLFKAGADNLVAGSFIFKNNKENYKSVIDSLRS